MYRIATVGLLGMSLAPTVTAQDGCDAGDWACWDMYPTYEDVPVWKGDAWNPEVDSPVLIYLHSLCAYGNTGVLEEETWLKLWPSSHDSSGAYVGLEDRVVETPDGDTGWLYVLPNGAVDPPPISENCPLAEGCRYWNAVPGCCAYNYFEPGSYTEISAGAPNHVLYINGLIRYLKDTYNIDENRVYIFGYSNGGYMAHRMACENGNVGTYAPEQPERISAIGSYAGVTFQDIGQCGGVWPTNILHAHDTGDEECLYDGGLDTEWAGVCYPGYPRPYPGALATVGSWILINETDGHGHFGQPITPFDLNVPYSSADTINWSGGREGSVVEHWRSVFGSHEPTFSSQFRTRLIRWFREHPTPGTPQNSGDPCPQDLDGNGVVDGGDLTGLLGNWNQSGTGDLDENGTVDGADILLLLGAWGTCPG